MVLSMQLTYDNSRVFSKNKSELDVFTKYNKSCFRVDEKIHRAKDNFMNLQSMPTYIVG